MHPWESSEPDERRIKHTADMLKHGTRLLEHEAEAVKHTALFGEHEIESLFALLGQAEVINLRLHRQLVEWHTRFPEKPSLQESDRFWRELKQLRSAKEQLSLVAQAISDYEQTINTLQTQLARTTESVDDVERYFDAYLTRVNES